MVVSLAFGWRHLLFENYPVGPAVVDPHLPAGVDLDTYDGDAWLSVVPFINVDLRPHGVPPWLGISLPEVNLRTYVTRDGHPGVYFFSLDAEGALSVLGARLFHHLPYYYARISLELDEGKVRCSSRRRHPGSRSARYSATYWPTDDPFPAADDPLASFLVERYRLFTEASDGSTRFTAVEHQPWTLYPAEATIETNTLFAAERFERPDAAPICYYSPGVDVVASPSGHADELG